VTGEVAEYASLDDRNVSKDVTRARKPWLARPSRAIR
jgi:hypothetical protein